MLLNVDISSIISSYIKIRIYLNHELINRLEGKSIQSAIKIVVLQYIGLVNYFN